MVRRWIVVAIAASAVLSGCGGTPDAGLAPSSNPSPTVGPGDEIWVAVLAVADDPSVLDADLAAARRAVGDYLADRVVVKQASCFEGLPPDVVGGLVLAIQDRAEHGVHAMYEEITDSPAFYGPVTLAC
jgi:hypothetical protein